MPYWVRWEVGAQSDAAARDTARSKVLKGSSCWAGTQAASEHAHPVSRQQGREAGSCSPHKNPTRLCFGDAWGHQAGEAGRLGGGQAREVRYHHVGLLLQPGHDSRHKVSSLGAGSRSRSRQQELFHLAPPGQCLWSVGLPQLRMASNPYPDLQICTSDTQHANARQAWQCPGEQGIQQASPVSMRLAASEVHSCHAEATISITPGSSQGFPAAAALILHPSDRHLCTASAPWGKVKALPQRTTLT